MQPQATVIEKLILSALTAFVTVASATVEIQPKVENALLNLTPLILAAQ
ncbi:hypothetical protein VB834_11900 [Limnoraphis robusta Tam1]|nr:hypothetical protein [Limnoraphis robusta]MEA5496555.1 hypothetical protein [Limnoraphis robusta BA-68 BA1]MEA5539733.1 hypothetical protein [Limnoraphis robusta Tam1]